MKSEFLQKSVKLEALDPRDLSGARRSQRAVDSIAFVGCALVCTLACLMFSACDEPRQENRGEATLERRTGRPATAAEPGDRPDKQEWSSTDDPQAAQSPPAPVKLNGYDNQTIHTALQATVRVVRNDGKGVGSGVMVGHRPPFTYVLTANHVVADCERVTVVEFSSKDLSQVAAVHLSAQVVAGGIAADLALLRFVSTQETASFVQVAEAADSVTEALATHAHLATYCLAKGHPQAIAVESRGPLRIRRDVDEEPTWSWQVVPALPPGCSGGGLIDRSGKVVGILSGTAEERGYYGYRDAAPKFLHSIGFAWLLEPGDRPL